MAAVAAPVHAPPAEQAHPVVPPRELALLLALVGGSAGLYLLLAGHRWDYLGHFTAGAGLALLAMLGARLGVTGVWTGPVGAAVVILLSAAGEAFLFSYLVYDWGDIGAGAVGATLVAGWRVRNDGAELPVVATVAFAVAFTIAGFVLRFGFDDVGTVA
jgi:hypothetical protein